VAAETGKGRDSRVCIAGARNVSFKVEFPSLSLEIASLNDLSDLGLIDSLDLVE